ncbi:hypothetical protein RCC89_15660 [Cytophagaceae bacterium ABcell3]|nr:hypothetical protein RCC89_15660 [Cytophagaceae bacterium ABcell3]
MMNPGDEFEVFFGVHGEYASPGSEGEDQVWDFSELPYNPGFPMNFFPPNHFGAAEKYPDATTVQRFGLWDEKFYFKVTEDGLFQENFSASGRVSHGGPMEDYVFDDPLTPPLQKLKFPVTYGDIFTSESEFYQLLQLESSNKLGKRETFKDSVIVDGWGGAIITPTGTYNNA